MSHTLQAWLYGAATFLTVVAVLSLTAWLQSWWEWHKGKRP